MATPTARSPQGHKPSSLQSSPLRFQAPVPLSLSPRLLIHRHNTAHPVRARPLLLGAKQQTQEAHAGWHAWRRSSSVLQPPTPISGYATSPPFISVSFLLLVISFSFMVAWLSLAFILIESKFRHS